MKYRNLINGAAGYVAGNAVSNSIIGGIRSYRKEIERKLKHIIPEEVISAEIAKFILANDKQGAFEYLNLHLNEEIVDAALRQNDFIYSLETIIQKKKNKYLPYYQQIGMDMPKQSKDITADQLCETLGVTNLHIIDSIDGKTSPSHSSEDFDIDLIIRAIILIGMIILGIVLGLS